MKKFFSLRAITPKSILLAKRFPVSILLIAGFASLLFVSISSYVKASYIPYQLYIFLSLGAIISVAATLWLEDFVSKPKQYIITVAITLLWGAYCLFLLPSGEDEPTVAKEVELSVIGIAAFLAMFFISFLKKDKDRAFWKFTMQMIAQFFLAVGFGTVVFSGLSIAAWAIDDLFDIYSYRSYLYLATFCYVLFASLYFLANIPDKIAKHNEEIALGKILKVLALYVLTPLAAIYAVISYVYLFKIIITWELPNGSVSYLVSSLLCVGLFVITLLYPARFFWLRYFGLIMLPLLALMSTGIFRRFDDYGITIHRGYVLLLNIWFYGICIYLFVTKAQRIKWIPVSFAAIALLASVGPWSIPNITKYILIAEVNNVNFTYMKQEEKNKIEDKVRYLRWTYGKANIQNLDTNINIYSQEAAQMAREKRKSFYLPRAYDYDNETQNIGNFNTFASVRNRNNKDVEYSCDSICTIKIISDERVFHIPMRKIVLDLIEDKNHKKLIFQGDDYIFLFTDLDGVYFETKDSIDVGYMSGYLFYNR